MTDTDKPKFEAIMRGLAENFGDSLSPVGIALRFEALKSYPFDEVKAASLSILANRRYTKMPTVAEFLTYLGGGSADDRAQVEAGKVWMALGSVGAYKNVLFDDPVTQAVIVQTFGGWQKLCRETMVDQQKWFIKDFCAAYGAFSRQGIKHFGSLPGITGEETRVIGNPEKAQKVMAGTNQKQIVDFSAVQKLCPQLLG